MRIFSLFVRSPELLSSGIMKTVFGVKAIGSPPFSVRTPFVSSLVSRFRNAVLYAKAIAKMPFAKGFFLLKKQLSSVPLLATRTPTPMNIGFC